MMRVRLVAAIALGIASGIPQRIHEEAVPAARPRQGRAALLRHWLRGWLDPRLLLIGVVMLGVELGEDSANNWLTLAVRNNQGQTAAVAALFFAAFAVVEATTRIHPRCRSTICGRKSRVSRTTASQFTRTWLSSCSIGLE